MKVPLKKGDILSDGYYIERIVGIGGMAIVGEARHPQIAGRVAIKMMLPEAVRSKEVVKRFEREQRTLSKLQSDHTLRVLGGGRHGKYPYMVMEFLQGSDLAELVKTRGRLPVERAVHYILQACHALAEAHSIGIYHRDLKPANLFLTRRTDGSPSIKVLDFGISKVDDLHREDFETTLTQTRAVMGSPFYMSPEQMLSTKDADWRTDIWALAVTLYELMTKSLPFAAASPDAVCRRILNDEPTPIRKIRPDVPIGLEVVLRRCLQRRPANRYQNIADFATDLAPFGPDFSEHALRAVYDYVEPTEPVTTRTGPLDGVLPRSIDPSRASSGDTASDTTIYLNQGQPRQRTSALLTAGLGLMTFAIGVGVGLLLSPSAPPRRPPAAMAATPSRETAATTQNVVAPPPPRAKSDGSADLVEELEPAPEKPRWQPPPPTGNRPDFTTEPPPPPPTRVPPPPPTAKAPPPPPTASPVTTTAPPVTDVVID